MKRERVPKEVREAADAEIERLTNKVEEVDELTGGRGSTGPSWAYHDGVRDQLLAEIDFLKKQNAELSRGTEALARQIDEANKRRNP